MAKQIYAVEITTEAGPTISRYFHTLHAARVWAKWCSKTFPARIMRGGQGGEVVA